MSIPSWISLVPCSLPELRFVVSCDSHDLMTLVKTEGLAPLRELTERDSQRAGRASLPFDRHRYFIDPLHYESFRVGANLWTYSMVTVLSHAIVFEDLLGDPEIYAAGDRLIAELVARGVRFTWSAHSYYSDSGEVSASNDGTDEVFGAQNACAST